MTNEKLIRAIERSQNAYQLYLKEKKYYQALRIFAANEKVYELLNIYIYECDEEMLSDIIAYLFHLEDWFNQFLFLESQNPGLEDVFIFNRFNQSPSFPKNFFKALKSIK